MELAGKRVLFFSVSYRPEHAGIGPYAAATAERLLHEGAQVQVIAGLPHYPSWRVAPNDRFRLRRTDSVGGVRVTRLRQFVPRRQTAIRRALYEVTFLLHGLLSRRTWQSADVVLAVVPALSGGLLARLAAARLGVPLVLIVQDLSAAGARQSGISGGRVVSNLVAKLETSLFLQAQVLGLVHESLNANCREMGIAPERLHLVPNWSIQRPDQHAAAVPSKEWKERFVVMHAGNMGLKQGLEVAVDAARLADEQGHDDLLFVLMGDGSQRERLERLAGGLRTLQIMGPVPEDDFDSVLGVADLALVTQRASVSDMSLPSKLTSYWNAGRAVIASVADDSGTAHEVRRSGGGIVVAAQDGQALLDSVLALRAAPEWIAHLEDSGRIYAIEHLSAQSGLDRVVALVTAGIRASV